MTEPAKFKRITARLRCVSCHGTKMVKPWRSYPIRCPYCEAKGWVNGEAEVLDEENDDAK